MGKGVQGLVMRGYRPDEYRFTVLDAQDRGPGCRRLRVDVGDLFARTAWYPTMWVRGWFPICEATTTPDAPRPASMPQAGCPEKVVMRGYTLIDPDEENGRATVDFYRHQGCASNWARLARPGDTFDVSMLGSKDPRPADDPDEYVLVGDSAALPAINDLLEHRSRAGAAGPPARVWFQEWSDADRDLEIAVGPDDALVRVAPGEDPVQAFRIAGVNPLARAWVACESRITRSLVKILREVWGLDRRTAIDSQAYWKA